MTLLCRTYYPELRYLLVHHLERDIVHVKRHVALVLDFRVEIQQVAVYIDAFQKVLDAETLAADVLHLAFVKTQKPYDFLPANLLGSLLGNLLGCL